jgi:hypothetical protein
MKPPMPVDLRFGDGHVERWRGAVEIVIEWNAELPTFD